MPQSQTETLQDAGSTCNWLPCAAQCQELQAIPGSCAWWRWRWGQGGGFPWAAGLLSLHGERQHVRLRSKNDHQIPAYSYETMKYKVNAAATKEKVKNCNCLKWSNLRHFYRTTKIIMKIFKTHSISLHTVMVLKMPQPTEDN